MEEGRRMCMFTRKGRKVRIMSGVQWVRRSDRWEKMEEISGADEAPANCSSSGPPWIGVGGEVWGGHKLPKYQYSLWILSDRIPFLWQKAVFWTPVIMRSRSNSDKTIEGPRVPRRGWGVSKVIYNEERKLNYKRGRRNIEELQKDNWMKKSR
jgi:hypothetical protein